MNTKKKLKAEDNETGLFFNDKKDVYWTLYVIRYVLRIVCICIVFLSIIYSSISSSTYHSRMPYVYFRGEKCE